MRNLITPRDTAKKNPPSTGEVLSGFSTHGKELKGKTPIENL
jgi:hypothetical protein